jgi:hypothetical protein
VAKTVFLVRYPLLKFMVPLAVVALGIGIYLFVADAEHDPMGLLPWLAAFAILMAIPFLWRRKEEYTVLLPTDRLEGADRRQLEGILETLEQQRDKGELSPERYTKARNRVLKAMKETK